MKKIIIDTNIVFACLRSQSTSLRNEIVGSQYHFYATKFLFVEIFKHKERILKNSTATEEETLELLSSLLNYIHFINERFIPTSTYLMAYQLCKEVDEKDTVFVALSLLLKCPIWTRDEILKKGLRDRGFVNFQDESLL